MACLYADNVLDNLAGLPILKLRFRQFAFLESIALVELAQGEHVGIKDLLLAGNVGSARPGRPAEAGFDVRLRIVAIAPVFKRCFSARNYQPIRYPGGGRID